MRQALDQAQNAWLAGEVPVGAVILREDEQGVPQVVASKWPIDSAVSSSLMKKFYRHLLEGEQVDTALKDAERDVRSAPETSHPYYWAAFSTFGSP